MASRYATLLKWLRTLHIYLSLLALVLLLFFALTGFLLNHEEWFSLREPVTRTVTGTLPVELLAEPDRLATAERLRADFGMTGLVASFEVEEESLKVVFKAPGRQAEAVIQREDGATSVTFESWGAVGWLTDLHRG